LISRATAAHFPIRRGGFNFLTKKLAAPLRSLAAVRSREKFGGCSSEQSWLVGILKNKIVDYYRKLALSVIANALRVGDHLLGE
jgi:hypothetical protein